MNMITLWCILLLSHTAHSFRVPLGQSSRLRKNLINFNGGDTKIFQQPNYSLHRITKVSSLSPLSSNKEDSENGEIANQNVPVKAIAGLLAFGAAAYGISQNVDFNGLIQEVLAKVSDLGPYGYVYFAAIYILLEVLAVPVVPMTASSGYLFGLYQGSLLVLISATIAASISFYIGRTFLRDWAVQITNDNPKWRAIDKAIAKEGFKVVLLLRLSPLLPFSLSNYIYGATSVDFMSFFAATLLGFAPGSIGFVYFGSIGKAFTGVADTPWYAIAAGAIAVAGGGKLIADFATRTIKEMEDLDALENSSKDTLRK